MSRLANAKLSVCKCRMPDRNQGKGKHFDKISKEIVDIITLAECKYCQRTHLK